MKRAAAAPLFGWQSRRTAALVDADRMRLADRIAKLPQRSRRRQALEILLAELTRKALAEEMAGTVTGREPA